jgi:hypothetical protein
MKEQIKQMIANLIIEQGYLKLTMKNLSDWGELTDEKTNWYLAQIEEKEEQIKGLKELLK